MLVWRRIDYLKDYPKPTLTSESGVCGHGIMKVTLLNLQ